MSQLLVQIYKLPHSVLRAKARVMKVKRDSHRVTDKSEQNITANLFCQKKDNGSVRHPHVVRGAMHSGKKRRSALWLSAMHSGKK